jgi:hypothetical protein
MTEIKAITWFQRFATKAVLAGDYQPLWSLAGRTGRLLAAHPKAAQLVLRRPYQSGVVPQQLRDFLANVPSGFDRLDYIKRFNAVKALGELKAAGSIDLLLKVAAGTKDKHLGMHDREAIAEALQVLGKLASREQAAPLLKDILAGSNGCVWAHQAVLAAAAAGLIALEQPAKGSPASEELKAYQAVYNYVGLYIAFDHYTWNTNTPMPEAACKKEAAQIRRFGKNAFPALARSFQVNYEPRLLRNLLALAILCDPEKGVPFVTQVCAELKDKESPRGLQWGAVNHLLSSHKLGTLRLI